MQPFEGSGRMSDLHYTVTDLPPVWPGRRTQSPRRAPFKSAWPKTLHILAREIRYLGGKNVEIALDLPRGAMDLRQDGRLLADARPRPPVILSFIDNEGQRQAYPCDRFAWWQDNLYAIAIVLEDLRRAERYGVQSALIRAGFKALPSTSTTTLNAQQAAGLIARESDAPALHILADADAAKSAVRTALNRTHPDKNGGSRDRYDRVDAARAVLTSHFGVSL
jgi:hypothetical protein